MHTTAQLNTALSGRYEIERLIGEGGMATVYLARDLRHNRKVALKVLKPDLGAVLGVDRFLSEIQVTANLQHPNLLPLFDSGAADSLLFYVMPFVEGESLRATLDREKQLPIEDAVRIATAIASALDYAHRRGVIHRDLKPENILMHEGQPLVADFGIALAVSNAGGDRMTQTNQSLGTPQYMSPEQATGDRPVDGRSDIYSLGAVTYEMLTGEPPHSGSTTQAIIARLLTERPRPVQSSRPNVPAHVNAAVEQALEKLPADRFATAKEFSEALTGVRTVRSIAQGKSPPLAAPATAPGAPRRRKIGLVALAVVGFAIAAWIGIAGGWRREAPQIARLALSLPDEQRPAWQTTGVSLALSPDGTRMVYVGPSGDGRQLWQRRMDQLEAQPIQGSEGGSNPVFSPDGLSVAFTAGELLKTVPLLGGPAFTVLDKGQGFTTSQFNGIDWGDDGMLYFNNTAGALLRVPATGGTAEALVSPKSGRATWVDALPEGGLVFWNRDSISVAAADGGEVRALFPGMMARYARSGHLVYATVEGALMAVPFDARRLEVTGPAIALIESVDIDVVGAAEFALSETGTLAYIPRTGRLTEPVRVTRNGVAVEIDPGWKASFFSLSLSPDGGSLAVSLGPDVSRGTGATQDIWIKKLDRGPLTRLTFEGGRNFRPSWANNQLLTFVSERDSLSRGSDVDIWIARADGTEKAQRLRDDDRSVYGAIWSADGAWLLSQVGGAGERDIIAWRAGTDSVPLPLVATPFDEYSPALSPDGRWLAYISNETGRAEIYVRPFPAVDTGKWQVSTNGGNSPLWAHSGHELFYQSTTTEMMAVQVGDDDAFVPGETRALFSTADYYLGRVVPDYAVTPDDQSFIMLRTASTQIRPDLTVVLNFFEDLRARGGK